MFALQPKQINITMDLDQTTTYSRCTSDQTSLGRRCNCKPVLLQGLPSAHQPSQVSSLVCDFGLDTTLW